MFDGFKPVSFMKALEGWDVGHREVRCVYQEQLTTFTTDATYLKEFKVDGGMILRGQWYIEDKVNQKSVTSTVSELCPECEHEVELREEFVAQTCPNCSARILPCAQCIDMKCATCPLEPKESFL